MKRLVLLTAAAMALTACGGIGKPAKSGPRPVSSEPGAPRPTEGLDWRFNAQGEQATLAYGDGAGNGKLLMTCTRASGQIGVTRAWAGEVTQASVTLASGSVRSSYAAQLAPSPFTGVEHALTFTAPSVDPLMLAFWRRNWVGVVDGDTLTNYAPQPGTRAVKDFFEFCG